MLNLTFFLANVTSCTENSFIENREPCFGKLIEVTNNKTGTNNNFCSVTSCFEIDLN